MKRIKKEWHHAVIDELVCRVASGALMPGDKLPSVTALAKQLSLRPRIVRKVFEHLCFDEVLVCEGKENYYLAKDVMAGASNYLHMLFRFRMFSPYDICQLRCVLDTAAVRLAFERIEALDLEILSEDLDRIKSSNVLESIAADKRCHMWLMQAAGSRLMECIMEAVWQICSTQVNLLLTDGELSLHEKQKLVHEKFYRGFRCHDMESVLEAVEMHYDAIQSALQELEKKDPQVFYANKISQKGVTI